VIPTAAPDPGDHADGGSALQSLMRRAAGGDRRAWERLVDKYSRLIWHITTREFNLVESDAADVAQTTWLRLLEHIDRLDPDHVGSWLAATAKQESRLKLAAHIAHEPDRPSSHTEIHRVRRAAISPRRLTDLAVFLADGKHSSRRDEWQSHLSGEAGRGLSRDDQIRAALGFLLAAMRLRLQDAINWTWRPADAVLRSRPLSNLFVSGPVTVMLVAIVRHDGRFGLVADIQDPAALWVFLYGAIRTGRWWRGIKPPEPKARRVKE
jgi:RNA polymerase sigma factor (sigma-70 family)